MKLPIDDPAILKEAVDIKAAASTPLAASVFIDDTAPGDLVGHVRSAFASSGTHTRVTICYLGDAAPVPYEADDIAVIVAGVSEKIGAHAAALREKGIPVMVVTTCPQLVEDMAQAFGHPIPEGDIVSPLAAPGVFSVDKLVARARREPKPVEGAAEGAEDASGAGEAAAADAAPEEPIALTDELRAALDTRMGEWIIAARKDKKLAFAQAFAFVRRPLSLDAVHVTSLQNGAVGVVMFIPGADMPVMTLNQVKMLLQIAAAYGQPMNTERIKELAAVVGGAFFFRNVARSVAGVVPVLGWAVKGAVGALGTEAMGWAAIEYFEAGGDIVGFASVVQKARDEAVDAATVAAGTPAGKKAIEVAKSAATTAFEQLRK